jgi:hypothetical protein
MRYSELLLPTLKETPTEAEVVSHRLRDLYLPALGACLPSEG